MTQKNKKSGFLSMLLGKLGASLLRNLLTNKGTLSASERLELHKISDPASSFS